MDNRVYLIERMKSKAMNKEEFDFDKLSAPPLLSLISERDIRELNRIATSLKYSAKPVEKRKMIDDIMKKNGFIFHIGGTNRLTYTYIHDDSFLVKVAYDNTGIQDSPAEYRNQFLYKPFVTKVFEVSRCGTIGLFERVTPITNREEFVSVAWDIFLLINNILVGDVVAADIGAKFFMNYGIRKGFGPVLLDFPYIYNLSASKRYCTAVDKNSISGCCDGVINYDPGFNFLYCTKCGAKYKAGELTEDDITRDLRMVYEKDIKKIDIVISGGTYDTNRIIKSGNRINEINSIPVKKGEY